MVSTHLLSAPRVISDSRCGAALASTISPVAKLMPTLATPEVIKLAM